jgi:peptidoglycan/LPS O-acetylase OafA/YrhL
VPQEANRKLVSSPRLVSRVGTVSYSLYLRKDLFLRELRSELARGAFRYLQQPPWSLLALLMCASLNRYLIEIP